MLLGVQSTDGNKQTLQASRFIVEVGSTRRHGGKRYNVSNVYPHPKFQGGSNRRHHDVGLLQLKSNIPIGKNSKYTKLAHQNDKIETGDDGVVSGWGLNPENSHDDRLYQVHLAVISNEECAELNYEDTAEGYEQHEICAHNRGKNFCRGDSGGPFVDSETGRQIGIVSYGNKDCTRELPSIFAKVQDNLDFINRIIAKTRRSRQTA